MLLIPPRIAIGLVLIWGSRGAAKSRLGGVAAPSSLLLSSPEGLTSSKASQTSLCLSLGFLKTFFIIILHVRAHSVLSAKSPPSVAPPALSFPNSKPSLHFAGVPLLISGLHSKQPHISPHADSCWLDGIMGIAKGLQVPPQFCCLVPPRHDVITHDHLLLFLPSSLSFSFSSHVSAAMTDLLSSPKITFSCSEIPCALCFSFFCRTSLRCLLPPSGPATVACCSPRRELVVYRALKLQAV